MKKWYHFVLTILTILMLVLVTFNKINNSTNWVDLSAYQTVISYVWQYGPILLLCLFAFGSLFGKIMSKIMFVLLTLLLIVFTITMFFPHVFG